jgi:novobiocin biosynthesis protein NovU/D-mycarose 3-C-methyltransferase
VEADIYSLHTTCRACGHDKLTKVFDLGLQPLANNFVGRDEQCAGYCPLAVLFCEKCTLAQLSVVVDPEILYQNYAYETSKSETMRLHFRSLWDAIKEQSKAAEVIEIGSNDGDFLAFARENWAEYVVGIDAAENLATVAIRRGIPTVIGILDEETAKCASRVVPHADVIVARHVFAHVDDWYGFIRNLDTLANLDTLIAIEVPYVVDTLARVEFDQVYHEHLTYVSLKAMEALLDGTPFRMQKVMRFPIHGGSIVIFLRRRDHPVEVDPSVQEFLSAENITVEKWAWFSAQAHTAIGYLKNKVSDLVGARASKRTGVTISGFGASAKSTVWISACGFTHREIKFICDCTPNKQGKFSPGTEIPIFPESDLMKQKPDYAIIFAWNYRDEIISKNQAYLDAGGHFIIPGRKLEIV